ncbi:major facilitator superfamily domain-containing protein [Scheffersomyces coipomensis]|uniref:major facilitator superfamily domain-containing protein n=1 Tax=Scheffersomyces coipomensis TaxID=1788519 RepID=UPI00315CD073
MLSTLRIENSPNADYINKLDIEKLSKEDDTQLEPVITEVCSLDSDSPSPSSTEISLFREILFVSLMCMSQLLTQAGTAQPMITSNEISQTFNVEGIPGEISWFSSLYSLTVGTFILISGRLGDMYGYKKLFIIGYVWFGIFSLITGFTGFTSSSIFFDTMRALQGIGPAIMMPNTQALLGAYYPPSLKKDICLSLFGAVAPSGSVIGALLSGMFAQLVWWPWSFWLFGIVSIVVALSSFFIIPTNIGWKSGGSFDFYGAICGVSGLVLFNFSWNEGPVVGWDKTYVYVLLICGVLCMVAFYLVEKRVKDPLVSPEVLKGDTGSVLGCIAAGWSCFGIWLFYTFRWALIVDGDTPVVAAVQNVPSIFVGFIAAISTAYMLQRIPSSIILLISMFFFLTGIILMGTRPVGQTYWSQKFLSNMIQSIGMDMSFPAGCIILSSALPESQQGIAGSLVSTVVNYSISIGLGLAGTVEYYVTKNMEPSLETTIRGMRVAFYMGMGLAGLGVVVATAFVLSQLISQRKNRMISEVRKGS